MLEVRIRRFETSYRLSPSVQAERRRVLDQLRMKMVERAFAKAVERVGLAEDSELCIRNLFASVSLRFTGTDESLVEHWSEVLADEIAGKIRNGSSGAVVYHSRRQAFVDMAMSVGRGDLRRSWAWRQLGLWRSGDGAAEGQTVFELVRSLCSEPAMVAPTLGALVASGLFPAIAGRLTQQHWAELAMAALSERGATHVLNQPGEQPSVRAAREAARVVKHSLLLHAIASSGCLANASVLVRRSIAALAVLDVEPTLLQTKNAVTVIGIIAGAAGRQQSLVIDSPQTAASFNQLSQESVPNRTVNSQQQLKQAIRTSIADQDTTDADEMALSLTADRAAPDAQGKSQRAEEVDSETGAGQAIEFQEEVESPQARASARLANRIVEPKGDAKPVDLRRRGFTRLGGLLFLFAVIEDLNLPEMILTHAVLSGRRFVWVVHQLAMTLAAATPTAVDQNDPAALAFAGLSPGATPPSHEEELSTEVEAEALCELAELIVDRLCCLLDFKDVPPASLLDFVCRRRAEIVADPGWIEVRLSLDEVSTEIRRAGLDLDPGYVSWLGVIVRFVYE